MHASIHPASGERKAFISLPVRVYYEDTDAGGVVYYANYLKFCERARTDGLRALGFEQARLAAEADLLFVEARVTIACVSASTGRPTPIPPTVRAQFATLV